MGKPADVVVHYLHDHAGANQTKVEVEKAGQRAVFIDGGLMQNQGQGA